MPALTDAMYRALGRAGGKEGSCLGGFGFGRWGATRSALHRRGLIDASDRITPAGAAAFAEARAARSSPAETAGA